VKDTNLSLNSRRQSVEILMSSTIDIIFGDVRPFYLQSRNYYLIFSLPHSSQTFLLIKHIFDEQSEEQFSR